MLSLTRKADYALVALADLARNSPALLSARAIAEKYRLPLPVLTNVLNGLTRCGLVVSTRGARGGYRLARPADRISVAEIVEAVEGSIRFAACCPTDEVDDPSSCELVDVCPIHGPIQAVHQIICDVLNRVTLDEIAFDRVKVGWEAASGSDAGLPQYVASTEVLSAKTPRLDYWTS